jgi:hypothetical protein
MSQWGPTICLDCRITWPVYCDTCALARAATIDKYNAYHREYQREMRRHPIQGPSMRASQRERSRRFRERQKALDRSQPTD